MGKKQYLATTDELEKKLGRVMERMGVNRDGYTYDWTQSRSGCSCFVEMRYAGRVYRFENSTQKSTECGRGLVYASDLFAAVVYSLEGLARAVEQGIFTLDMLLCGVPSLPAAQEQPLELCFVALGFDHRPKTVEQVKEYYHKKAMMRHPDKGGSDEAFAALTRYYKECLAKMEVAADENP